MNTKLKNFAIYASIIFSITLLIIGITLGIVHSKNSQGKGGLESPNRDTITEELLFEEVFSEEKTETDLDLSYFTYRVKKGDMIGFIADEFGVTQDTIISVNNIKSSRLIQIGQYLRIPSMPGILYTVKNGSETPISIAKKYEVNAEKCASVNNLKLEESLDAGKIIFVPDAELDWVTRQEINGDLFKRPLRSRYYFSSLYGWRKSPFDSSKRTFHGGIDMACAKGTPIYAALDGTVSKTGWSDVYGNFVMVKHHSGYVTLYAHMNKITTKKGAKVYTNTKIGEVGNTGLSTGPHLHFTVYKNGRSVNPANLWK
jgi:murein DD-endopeptidase MepM/ murein hydrolase activator NlpD